MELDASQNDSPQDLESYLTDFGKQIEQTQNFSYQTADNSVVTTNTIYTTDEGVVYQTAAIPVSFKQEGVRQDQMVKQLPQQVMGTIRMGDGGIELLTSNGAGESQGTTFTLASGLHEASFAEQPLMQVTSLPDSGASLQMEDCGSGDHQGMDGNTVQVHPGLGGSVPFQTVTIVPSEVNQSGEVSYMLIVSQPEEDKSGDANADMSVFDFKGEDAMKAEGVQADDSTKVKATVRSQPAGMPVQLMCNYCNYTSPKRFLLARHMRAHSEERPYNCTICSRTFKTSMALQNHVNTHKGIRPNKCKECDACFTTSGELIRHVRYRHTYEKPHKCTECDYASVELSKLKRHVRSHTGERPFQCPQCMYASPDSFKLKRHLRVHTGEKPYVCDICDMHFTQSNSLKSHKLIHTGNKPVFQCELCPTTCGRKTDLKNHVLKIHTSDRPLQCKKCGKSFPDRYTYKIHTRTHDGQKCFRCELCPYSALMQRHLESHILTHTGEKPFRCNTCDQSFRQKQLLKRHINLYHNPEYVPPEPRTKQHTCKECNKVFAHRGNMLRHLAMHDPENAEYQHALQNGDASLGEEEDEEEEEEEMDGEGHQADGSQGVDGQLYEDQYISHQHPIQVQLVPVQGEEGQQVYIQIDSSQMGLLQQMEAVGVTRVSGDAQDGVDSDARNEEVMITATTARRPRGRPRKSSIQPPPQEESDEDYVPTSTPRRGRGRPRKIYKTVVLSQKSKKSRVVVKEEEQEEEEQEEEEQEEEERQEEEQEENAEEEEQEMEGMEEEEEEEENGSEEMLRKRQADDSVERNPSKRPRREATPPTLEFDVDS